MGGRNRDEGGDPCWRFSTAFPVVRIMYIMSTCRERDADRPGSGDPSPLVATSGAGPGLEVLLP